MFFNSQLCNFCDLKGPSAHTHRESYHFQECNHQERPPYSELSVFNQLAPSGLSSSRLHLLKYLKTAAMNLSIFYYPIKYPKFFFFFCSPYVNSFQGSKNTLFRMARHFPEVHLSRTK